MDTWLTPADAAGVQGALKKRLRVAALSGFTAGLLFVVVSPLATPAPADADAVAAMPLPRVAPRTPVHGAAPAARPTAPDAPSPPEPGKQWAIPAGEIDPDAATVDDKRLVQILDDGTRIELTLDPMLQRAAKSVLAKYKVGYGAIVAIRPRTGEVLAMAEHAEQRPELEHLALQAEGPAASIFKIITSGALMQYGGLHANDTICVRGGRKGLTLRHLSPDARRDKNCETFAEALGSSNNAAFARWTDQLLRPDQLQAMADRFLFNRRLPFLWTSAVSKARVPTGSRLGFVRAAAGFEGSNLSPLHAALIAASVANDGVMMAPRIVHRAVKEGRELYAARPARIAQVLPPQTAKALNRMMVSTTTTGSAAKFFEKKGRRRLPDIDIAGKTGSLSARDTGVSRHYSWFVASAPAESPEIAIAALVVNGESWTIKGVVAARAVLDTYFVAQKTGPRSGSP